MFSSLVGWAQWALSCLKLLPRNFIRYQHHPLDPACRRIGSMRPLGGVVDVVSTTWENLKHSLAWTASYCEHMGQRRWKVRHVKFNQCSVVSIPACLVRQTLRKVSTSIWTSVWLCNRWSVAQNKTWVYSVSRVVRYACSRIMIQKRMCDHKGC
jgi:hypothetical protein